MDLDRRSGDAPSNLDTAVVVPTFNEASNVSELVHQLNVAFAGWEPDSLEIFFVDDSTDDTPDRISDAAASSRVPVRLLHRDPHTRAAGLASAVATALAATDAPYVVVMDGDLQHPPAVVPQLREALDHADLAIASRYYGAGTASGLSSSFRHAVSTTSTTLARACFPRRVGRVCTDPMTGFFALRRSAIDLTRLRPRGFKILLEIMARHDLQVTEIPFTFGERHGGTSKAGWRNGLAFMRQLLALRMGRMSQFALVGALGTVVNLAIMATLMLFMGSHYILAAALAAEFTIVQNFVLQELWVFRDLRDGSRSLPVRAASSLAYNNLDMVIRLPVLYAFVTYLDMVPIVAQGITLGIAFFARFLFTSLVVYRDTAPRGDPVKTQPVTTCGVLLNR
jgi:dolichol-phosphate mannosyltransferase